MFRRQLIVILDFLEWQQLHLNKAEESIHATTCRMHWTKDEKLRRWKGGTVDLRWLLIMMGLWWEGKEVGEPGKFPEEKLLSGKLEIESK